MEYAPGDKEAPEGPKKRIQKPEHVRRTLQDDDIVDVFQDRADGIQQQDRCPFPEQGSIVKDGREKYGERDQDLYYIFHIPEEKICAGKYHSQRQREKDQHNDKEWDPYHLIINMKSGNRKDEDQDHGPKEKIEQIREYGGYREHFPREVDLGDEAGVPDQAIRGESDGSDEKRIRKGFDGDRGKLRKVHWFS